MKKPRARLVIPRALSVAVVTVAALSAGGCSKEESPEEEGGCVALDEPDSGPKPDCSQGPDAGVCPTGCTYI